MRILRSGPRSEARLIGFTGRATRETARRRAPSARINWTSGGVTDGAARGQGRRSGAKSTPPRLRLPPSTRRRVLSAAKRHTAAAAVQLERPCPAAVAFAAQQAGPPGLSGVRHRRTAAAAPERPVGVAKSWPVPGGSGRPGSATCWRRAAPDEAAKCGGPVLPPPHPAAASSKVLRKATTSNYHGNDQLQQREKTANRTSRVCSNRIPSSAVLWTTAKAGVLEFEELGADHNRKPIASRARSANTCAYSSSGEREDADLDDQDPRLQVSTTQLLRGGPRGS